MGGRKGEPRRPELHKTAVHVAFILQEMTALRTDRGWTISVHTKVARVSQDETGLIAVNVTFPGAWTGRERRQHIEKVTNVS